MQTGKAAERRHKASQHPNYRERKITPNSMKGLLH
jgi:hypothetical protein